MKPLIIAFADNHISLNPQKDNGILLKLLQENSESFHFTVNNSPIIIGRSETSNIKLMSVGASRFQCYITFKSKDNLWTIEDGSINGKHSTNGTWIFASEELELQDNSIIKAGDIMFQIGYISK